MPEKKNQSVFTLPKEIQDRMKTSGPEFEKAQRAIDVMKDLGMDVREIQERLDWAKRVRETLLKEFA